jgi:2-polyprenyl-3-methyl-5-hydroxy-6-metoxy-1,4-benzoquinol methylase
MSLSYNLQTVDSKNPLARYAHRNRIQQSIALTLPKLASGKVLDYGCGSGVFVAALLKLKPGSAVGYEPYMQERVSRDLPIYKEILDVKKLGPYSLVSLFETIEHLSNAELDDFLNLCESLLPPSGGILISAPIEIGPALLLKEFNRSLFRFKLPEHRLWELLKASFLAIPASRAVDLKTSHKGFDFRLAIKYLQAKGWNVSVMRYGPLPIGTWYGNSQVYMWLKKN